MKSFSEFYNNLYHVIDEAIHKELQSILDSPGETPDEREQRLSKKPFSRTRSDTADPAVSRLAKFTKKARELLNSGKETGLKNSRPKKGSSRAVFLPQDPEDVTVDGQRTKMHSAIKIAFEGFFDKKNRTEGEPLLGEMQNRSEGNPEVNRYHGVLRKNSDGTYTTNHYGVLPPLMDSHDQFHHLKVGRVDKFTSKEFSRLTITRSHPNGLNWNHVYDALNVEHRDAHGIPPHIINYDYNRHDRIMRHPFVVNMVHMMQTSGMHPADLSKQNMGIWEHPVTGKRYPVIADSGFTTDISHHYTLRRARMAATKHENIDPMDWTDAGVGAKN